MALTPIVLGLELHDRPSLYWSYKNTNVAGNILVMEANHLPLLYVLCGTSIEGPKHKEVRHAL